MDAQIERLGLAADVTEPASRVAGVTKEAAILQAITAMDTQQFMQASAELLAEALKANANATTQSARDLSAAVTAAAREHAGALRELAIASDANTAAIVRWTKILGWTTIVLVLVAAAEVFVQVLQLLKP